MYKGELDFPDTGRIGRHEMREDEETEKDRTYKHGRGENTQMAQRCSLHGNERQERTYRCYIAHNKRGEHFIQSLAHR